MGSSKQPIAKPDITKEESGLEQNDRLSPTREPSISYDENGKRIKNDIGMQRTAAQDDAMDEAMINATGNRRDQPTKDTFVKDHNDPAMGR